jgi:hypothetical protein
MLFLLAAAFAFSSSASASPMRTAECRSDIQDCYGQMRAACHGEFRVIDRSAFYGDILVSELPGNSPYNTYVFECAN